MSSVITPQKAAPLKARVGYFEDVTSLPVTMGLETMIKAGMPRRMQTVADCRQQFVRDELEVALLPSSDCLRMPNISIIPCSCSAAKGSSRLLMLFSKKIPTEMNRILVDQEDCGATPLAKLILAKKLSIRPQFVASQQPLDPAKYDLLGNDGYDGYLLTGKHCFFVRKDAFSFAIDLTGAWYEYTGLPYVIHVWAMKKGIKLGVLEREIGEAARRNEGSTDTIARSAERTSISSSSVRAVYEKALVTGFDPVIIQSLRKYGQELHMNRIAPTQPISIYTPPVIRKVG